MNDDLQKLYEAVSSEFDIGTFEEFSSKMQSPEDRKRFYDAVSKNGLNLGDYNTYESRLKKKDQKEVSGDVADGTSDVGDTGLDSSETITPPEELGIPTTELLPSYTIDGQSVSAENVFDNINNDETLQNIIDGETSIAINNDPALSKIYEDLIEKRKQDAESGIEIDDKELTNKTETNHATEDLIDFDTDKDGLVNLGDRYDWFVVKNPEHKGDHARDPRINPIMVEFLDELSVKHPEVKDIGLYDDETREGLGLTSAHRSEEHQKELIQKWDDRVAKTGLTEEQYIKENPNDPRPAEKSSHVGGKAIDFGYNEAGKKLYDIIMSDKELREKYKIDLIDEGGDSPHYHLEINEEHKTNIKKESDRNADINTLANSIDLPQVKEEINEQNFQQHAENKIKTVETRNPVVRFMNTIFQDEMLTVDQMRDPALSKFLGDYQKYIRENNLDSSLDRQELLNMYQNSMELKQYSYWNDPSYNIPKYVKDNPELFKVYSQRKDFPFLPKDINNKLNDINSGYEGWDDIINYTSDDFGQSWNTNISDGYEDLYTPDEIKFLRKMYEKSHPYRVGIETQFPTDYIAKDMGYEQMMILAKYLNKQEEWDGGWFDDPSQQTKTPSIFRLESEEDYIKKKSKWWDGVSHEDKIKYFELTERPFQILNKHLDNGWSNIGGGYLHLESGTVLTSKDGVNPLIASGGLKAHMVNEMAKNPDFFKGMTDKELIEYYNSFNQDTATWHNKKIAHLQEKIEKVEGRKGLGKWINKKLGILEDHNIELDKEQYGYKNMVLNTIGELTKQIHSDFDAYGETIGFNIDSENANKRKSQGEVWLDDQYRLIKRYPHKPNGKADFEKMTTQQEADYRRLHKLYVEVLDGTYKDGVEESEKFDEENPLQKMKKSIVGTNDKLYRFSINMEDEHLLTKELQKNIKIRLQKANEIQKEGGLRKFFYNAGNVTENVVDQIAIGLTTIPQRLGGLFSDEENYDWKDRLIDEMSTATERMSAFETPTELSTGWKYYEADVNGYKVITDEGGKLLKIITSDFMEVDYNSEEGQKIYKEYTENPDKYKTEKKTNNKSRLNNALNSGVNLLLDIMVSRKLAALGKTNKARKYIGIGTMMGTYNLKQYNEFRMKAIDQGMSPTKATDYANLVTSICSVTQAINPNLNIFKMPTFATSKMAYRAALNNIGVGGMAYSILSRGVPLVAVESGMETLQELSELETERLLNGTVYRDLDFDLTRDVDLYKETASIAAALGGLGGATQIYTDIRNHMKYGNDRMYMEGVAYAYENRNDFFKSIKNSVGNDMWIDGELINLTKAQADEKIEYFKNLFKQTDNLVKSSDANLDDNAKLHLVNLMKEKNSLLNLQGATDPKVQAWVKGRISDIDNRIERIVAGEDVGVVMKPQPEFDLDINEDNLSESAKHILRKQKQKAEWGNIELKDVTSGIRSSIEELKRKKKLTKEEKKILNIYEELLNDVKSIKPTINEESNTEEDEIISKAKKRRKKAAPVVEGETETIEQTDKVESVREADGTISTKISPISGDTRIAGAIGRVVTYDGKTGVLDLDADGNPIIRMTDNPNVYIKIPHGKNKTLRKAGISIAPKSFKIHPDGTISIEGQSKKNIIGVTKNKDGQITSIVLSNPKTSRSAKTKLNKLRAKFQNGEIDVNEYIDGIGKIKGVTLVTDPDITTSMAIQEATDNLIISGKIKDTTPEQVDSIIEEEVEGEKQERKENKRFNKWYNHLFSIFRSRGLRPDIVFQRQLSMQGNIKARMFDLDIANRKLMDAIAKHAKKKGKKLSMAEINDALTDPHFRTLDRLQNEISKLEAELSDLTSTPQTRADIRAKLKARRDGIRDLTQAHKGKTKLEDIKVLDKNLYKAMVNARNMVDNLSQKILEKGIVGGKLKATIEANLGIYLTSQYRSHHDSDYQKHMLGLYEKIMSGKLSDSEKRAYKREIKILNRAITYIQNDAEANYQKELERYYKKYPRGLDENGRKVPKPGKVTDEYVENRINEIFGKTTNPDTFIAGVKTLRSVDYIFKAKKDIPEELLELYNEVENPVFNFVQSVTSMVRTLEMNSYRNDVLDSLHGDLIMSPVNGKAPSKDMNAKIIINGREYYTYPFLADDIDGVVNFLEQSFFKGKGFMGAGRIVSPIFKFYFNLLTLTKTGLTIWSLPTHIRNFISNTGFAIKNGHINPGLWAKGMNNAFQIIKNSTSEQKQAIYRAMLENGIVESARMEELQSILELGGDKDFAEFMFDPSSISNSDIRDMIKTPKKPGILNAFKRVIKGGLGVVKAPFKLFHKGTAAMYMYEDVAWKASGFLHEISRYENAGFSREEAIKKAGEIIKNVYPTYSLIPPIAKALRAFPLAGTFVSWPAEVLRTNIETAKLTIKELFDKNSKVKKIGVKRLAGLTTSLVSQKFVMTTILKAVNEIKKMLSDDEEDEGFADYEMMETDNELESLLKFVGAPWNKHGDIIVINKEKPGVYITWNVLDNISDGYIHEIVNATRGTINQKKLRQLEESWKNGDMSKEQYFSEREALMNKYRNIEDPTMNLILNNPTLHSVLEPFLGKDILWRAVSQLANNRDEYGDPIWNPKADSEEVKITKMFGHLFRDIAPAPVKSAIRLLVATDPALAKQLGNMEEWGVIKDLDLADNISWLDGNKERFLGFNIDKEYDTTWEYLAFASGIRGSKIDISESFKYGIKRVQNELRELSPFETIPEDYYEHSIEMYKFLENLYLVSEELGIEFMHITNNDGVGNMPHPERAKDRTTDENRRIIMLDHMSKYDPIYKMLTRNRARKGQQEITKDLIKQYMKSWQREVIESKEYKGN